MAIKLLSAHGIVVFVIFQDSPLKLHLIGPIKSNPRNIQNPLVLKGLAWAKTT